MFGKAFHYYIIIYKLIRIIRIIICRKQFGKQLKTVSAISFLNLMAVF